MNKNYAQIPNDLFDRAGELGIAPEELALICCLWRFKFGKEVSWPSFERLAQMMGRNERRVREYAARLERKGFLKKSYGRHYRVEFDLSPLLKKLSRANPSDLEAGKSGESGSAGRANPSDLLIRGIRLIEEDKNMSSANAEVTAVVNAYHQHIRPDARLTDSARKKIQTRLKTYKSDELTQAIQNFSVDTWWMDHNGHRAMAWFFHNDDRIDGFLAMNGRSDTLECPMCHKAGKLCGDNSARCPNDHEWEVL